MKLSCTIMQCNKTAKSSYSISCTYIIVLHWIKPRGHVQVMRFCSYIPIGIYLYVKYPRRFKQLACVILDYTNVYCLTSVDRIDKVTLPSSTYILCRFSLMFTAIIFIIIKQITLVE